MFDIDAQIVAARKRIWLAILRTIHFANRSAGQKRRRQRERTCAAAS